MIFNKSRDIEDQELGINERLLGVGEGGLWTESEESYRCTSVAVTLLHFTILGIIFLVGVLFGFFFRGDLDGVCSDYVSQYCEQAIPGSSTSLTCYSAYNERSWHRLFLSEV